MSQSISDLKESSTDEEMLRSILQLSKEEKPETVERLVQAAKEKLKITEEKAIKAILALQNEGKLKLTAWPTKEQQRLGNYVKTQAALWYWATITLSAATAAIVFIVPENFFPWIYARNVLGAIFVLWLPGYAVIKALFPQSTHRETTKKNLDNIERVALSIGMSLAIVPMIGLLLYYTPWGIGLTPTILSLLGLTIAFATTAVLREHQAQTREQNPNRQSPEQ